MISDVVNGVRYPMHAAIRNAGSREIHHALAILGKFRAGSLGRRTGRHYQRWALNARPGVRRRIIPHRANDLRLIFRAQDVVYLPVSLIDHRLNDTLHLVIPAHRKLSAHSRKELCPRPRHIARS